MDLLTFENVPTLTRKVALAFSLSGRDIGGKILGEPFQWTKYGST